MFRYDPAMTELIIGACRQRLSMDPVALDYGGLVESLDAELAGLMRPEGNDAAGVLALFVEKLATAVVSCDSPPLLGLHPGRADQGLAALRHVRVLLVAPGHLVAGGGRRGGGREPGARGAGRPRPASRPVPAAASCRAGRRATCPLWWWPATPAAHRRHRDAPARPAVAVSEDAHSSVGKALRVLGVEPVTWCRRADHRLTGAALRDALERRSAPRRRRRRGGHGRDDQRRDRRRPRHGVADVAAERASVVPHRRRLRRRRRSSPLRCGTSSTASSGPTRSSSTPTSGCSRPSTARHSSTASRIWPRRCTPRTPSTSTSSTPTGPRSGTRATTPST